MRKNSIFFILGLILFSCNFQSEIMTTKEFTRAYHDSLSAKFPSAKFKIIDDSTIESSYLKNTIRISADNAFKEYQSEPDSLSKVISKYLSVAGEFYNPKEKVDQNRIVPIIKPISYLEDIKDIAKKMGAVKDIEGVYEKYNNQLIIVYAEDTKSSIRYLTQDDIKSLSINIDSLRSIAINNLDKLLTNIQAKGENGVYMLTAGGDYEASIILLNNVLTKESFPVNGDFVIAIPTRDILLITGSNDPDGISKIRDASKKTFETGSYQVSAYLYKWNGKIFEKYPGQ